MVVRPWLRMVQTEHMWEHHRWHTGAFQVMARIPVRVNEDVGAQHMVGLDGNHASLRPCPCGEAAG